MFIYDLIKIKYINEGYIQNYPYHLTSDEEMCDAFLDYDEFDTLDDFLEESECFFVQNYPLIDSELSDKYEALIDSILEYIHNLKESTNDVYILPDWVCEYMIGSVLGVNSDQKDIHDMLVLMDMDNLDDVFTKEICEECYRISSLVILNSINVEYRKRKPGLFGESDVLKYLRLKTAGLL